MVHVSDIRKDKEKFFYQKQGKIKKNSSLNNARFIPFSEKAMLVIGPWWPGKLATFSLPFKSQIFIMESSVPVPKMSPSG